MTTSTAASNEGIFRLDTYFYHEQVNRVIGTIAPQFESVIKRAFLFHLSFAILFLVEVLCFMAFFAFLLESSLVAFALALIFLTIFGYFALRIYLQTKQPQQFKEIKQRYYKACHQLLDAPEVLPEHYVTLANALCKFSSALEGREHALYRPPKWLSIFTPSIDSFSHWWHGKDFRRMKELLLLGSVEEHVKLVKWEPTSLEVHAALANAYVMLSELYRDQDEKFRITSERAIEELRILHDYAPNDPWIHIQLAYSYHDLKMPREEMREYEEVLRLSPKDQETLFKLGLLYFQEGFNGKGLRVYEMLKKQNRKKARRLIEKYGSVT